MDAAKTLTGKEAEAMFVPSVAFHRVIFRDGGTLVWRWREVITLFSSDGAEASAAKIRRMGFHAIIVTHDELKARGLPQTFAADEFFPREGR